VARRELVVACTLIGALGGALFGFALVRSGDRSHLIASLTVCTALSATLLGWFLARRIDDAIVVGGRAVWASFVAGAFNGVLMIVPVGMFGHLGSAGVEAALAAAIFGTICAIPFAPAIIVVAMTAAYADARADSIAARSQGRRVLRNAVVCLASAAGLFGALRAERAAHVPLFVSATALGVIAIVIALELHALRRLAPRAGSWEPAPDGIRVDETLDYGVGLELWIRRAHDETYREVAAAIEVHRGDRERARGLIVDSLRGHGLASAGTLLALFLNSPR